MKLELNLKLIGCWWLVLDDSFIRSNKIKIMRIFLWIFRCGLNKRNKVHTPRELFTTHVFCKPATLVALLPHGWRQRYQIAIYLSLRGRLCIMFLLLVDHRDAIVGSSSITSILNFFFFCPFLHSVFCIKSYFLKVFCHFIYIYKLVVFSVSGLFVYKSMKVGFNSTIILDYRDRLNWVYVLATIDASHSDSCFAAIFLL